MELTQMGAIVKKHSKLIAQATYIGPPFSHLLSCHFHILSSSLDFMTTAYLMFLFSGVDPLNPVCLWESVQSLQNVNPIPFLF